MFMTTLACIKGKQFEHSETGKSFNVTFFLETVAVLMGSVSYCWNCHPCKGASGVIYDDMM